jgi:hypothetical protein
MGLTLGRLPRDYRTMKILPSFPRLGFSSCTLLVALLAIGCGGRSDLGLVTGTVTLDGKPLPSAFLVFAPTGGGTSSRGKTDASGHYEMMFTDSEKGAWIGENVVRINTGDVGGGDQAGPKELVPVAYNRDTTLKVEVKPGNNNFDFPLTSNAGRIQAAPVE